MRECAFPKEPLDYKLIALRFCQKIWVLLVCAIAGALVYGGLYFLAKEVIGTRTYQAESVYYITFTTNEKGEESDYYNHYTWDTAIKEDALVNQVALVSGETAKTVKEAVTATVESDVRYMFTRVVTTDAEKSLRIAKALEQEVTNWAESKPEFAKIEISQAAVQAKDNSNIRTLNACVLGGVLGCFLGLFGLLLHLVSEDAVYVPATLEKRYGIKTLTAPSMQEYVQNCEELFGDKKKIACISGAFGYSYPNMTFAGKETIAFDNPCEETIDLEALRSTDAVVVYVPAGKACGKQVERTLEQLSRVDISVTATVLVEESKKLLKAYYR